MLEFYDMMMMTIISIIITPKCNECTRYVFMLHHCWLGDKKGIWSVKNPVSAIPKSSHSQAFREPDLTWSNRWNNRLVKLKPSVVACSAEKHRKSITERRYTT